MMALYVQNFAIARLKSGRGFPWQSKIKNQKSKILPAGQPLLMDLRATGRLRMGILAVLLAALGLGHQWNRLHSGHPPSGKELETLSSALGYVRAHAGGRFQR